MIWHGRESSEAVSVIRTIAIVTLAFLCIRASSLAQESEADVVSDETTVTEPAGVEVEQPEGTRDQAERSESEAAEAEALVIEPASPDVWRNVRLRVESQFARLRASLSEGTSDAAFQDRLEKLESGIEELVRLSESFAPGQYARFAEAEGEVDRLLDYLAQDYVSRDRRRLGTTMQLLEQRIALMEDLAVKADLWAARTRPSALAPLPDDWTDLRYPLPELRMGLSLLSAKDLHNEMTARAQSMRDLRRNDLRTEGVAIARELGEMARALVTRQGEVPIVSRPGFRNVALQIEVISENLAEFAWERDRADFSRQVFQLREALERIDLYLRLSDPIE